MKTPGSTVSVPAGTYYVSDAPPMDRVSLSIDGATNLTLRGAGVGATVLVLRSERDAHVIALSQSRDVTVTALRIDGRRSGRKDTHGIRVADSTSVRLAELWIHSVAHYGHRIAARKRCNESGSRMYASTIRVAMYRFQEHQWQQ